MAIYIIIVLLGLSHINFLSARKYHTLVKPDYQSEDLQIHKDENIFNVPLVPLDESEPVSDLEHGLRIIKLRRKLLDNKRKFDQIHEQFRSRHNEIHPKKFHHTYSIPHIEIAKEHTQRGNKHINDTEFILPKEEIKQAFYPTKLNIDESTNEKGVSNVDVKVQEIPFVKSQSSAKANSSSAVLKNEDENKKEAISQAELSVPTFTSPGYEYNINPLHAVLDPYILNNHDILKHIYHRFLVGPIPYHFSQFGSHQLDSQPNVVNIYYDKRFMQNAPGSHSFIYGAPIEDNRPVPEPVTQIVHVPTEIHDAQPIDVSPPVHLSQPINVHPLVHVPQPVIVSSQTHEPQQINVFSEIQGSQPVNIQQPIFSPQPIHLSEVVPQNDATHAQQHQLTHLSLDPQFDSHKTDTIGELHLKQPEQPINFNTNVENDIIDKYFLPKLEVNTEFKEKPIYVPDIVYESSPLLSPEPHVKPKPNCKSKCRSGAPKSQYRITVWDPTKEQQATSYDVPLY